MRTLAALSLAAGIGFTAALASIVDAILLRPLPVARPKEIARLFTASEGQPFGFVSYPDFEDFRKARPMVAECLIPVTVGDPPKIQLALAVTDDYFKILGVSAKFGRTFSGEDREVAILARGNANDLGQTLRIAGKLYSVVGIAPENFGLDRFLHADLYILIHSYGDGRILTDRARRFLTVHVRGIDSGPELDAIARRLEREHPETNRGRRAVVLDEITARLRTDQTIPRLAGLLSALAALILAIAFSNACGALLLRGDARSRETALKLALGASPVRLLGESMREAGGISLIGCALGLSGAWIVKEALRRSIVLPTDFGISIAARFDWRVMALAFAAGFVATLLCGIAPSCVRVNVWSTLKAQERSSKSGVRNLLALIEIAVAAALLSTGGSLWTGLNAAKNTDLGYRADRISVMTFDPGQAGYNETRTRAFYRELMERAKTLPGVRGVALAQSVPLGMTGAQKQIRIGDREEITVWMNIVTPEYFERMHIAFVQGRTFNNRDGVIVNEELAKQIEIGEKMQVAGKTVEVIGVVKTAKYMRWDEAPRPFFYLPYAQNYASRMTLHIESDQNVFEAVRGLAREIPASDVRTLREYFDNGAMFAVKAALKIAAVTGGGGLLLALAGLYVMVSNSVERRRREIGIRIALGARPAAVFTLIVRQGMTIAALGTAAGLVAARLAPPPAASSWKASAGAAILTIMSSLIACAVPAIRALAVDPAVALRED
ncbi:MAG TPA: ABC transporter permease [Bryobacteraceae bacterium]|jgi:putative ABC transport system permease protein|nr:ABC transporter permease [Bryobacteraceae bacterium]